MGNITAPATKKYVYEGYVENVVDGDTFDAIVGLWSWTIPLPVASLVDGGSSVGIDVGFRAHVLMELTSDGLSIQVEMHERFRMFGINAPEVHGVTKEKGLRAKEWLEGKIEGQNVTLETKKSTEKYGRWLATVLVGGVSINDAMVEAGHAVDYVP